MKTRRDVELTLDSSEEDQVVDNGSQKTFVSLVVVRLVVVSVDLSRNDGPDLNATRRKDERRDQFRARRSKRRQSEICSRDVVEGG